jgi:hypothetical protein
MISRMRNAPDNDNNERAIAIALLRDTIARRTLLEIDRVIERMIDEALASPNSQLPVRRGQACGGVLRNQGVAFFLPPRVMP